MATIDSFEIQIKSSAQIANNEINKLIGTLGKLATALNIDTSGLENIGKSLNLYNIDKASKNIQSQTQKVSKSLEQINEQYKDIGKNFTLKGSIQFIQKNIDGLTNQLAKATLAKERFETSGKTDLAGYEKAVAKVIELKNQIESLNNQLETMRTASRAVNIDFETTGLIETIKPLQEFKKELQDIQEHVKVTEEVYKGFLNIPKGSFDHNINELEASLNDLKNTYPQATKTISDFEQELQNLKDISGKLTGEYTKVNIDTSSVDEISNVKNEFEELRIKLSQLEIPPIREDNLEKLQSALGKTEAKLDELNTKLQNEVTMGRVAENVDDKGFVKLEEQIALTEKTAEALRKKIKEVENTTKSTGKQNSIVNKLANSFKNLSNKAEKSVKPIDNMSKAFKNMARNILPILGIRELFSFGKESIENSMNYLETLNYFNKAFEQVASKADLRSFEEMGYESADAYYKSFNQRAKELTSKMTGFEISDAGKLSATGAASLGIDPTQLMNYQAMFAQMSSSMGVASETSLKLSQALTEIGADLASVRNMDFDKVWQDMASGLAGMSRTLDKYGVNIRNVNLQQKLNELGINANISALNQENKVMLRSIILLESTKYAYADLAKTINAPANQLRLLKSNFANLSRTIGNIFLPIVSKILPYINGLTIALQRLLTFIGELIGLDMDLSSLGGTGSNETADDILGDLQDNLDNASESAKELKNELLGFDEVNKLSDTLDTEGAGTGIGGIDSALLDKAFDDALSKYQETWDKAFANMENGSNIIADKIEKALEPVKKIIKDFAIGDFFSAGEDVSDLVISINEFIAKAIDDVEWDKIGENVGNFLKGIKWGDIFLSLVGVIREAFQGMFEFVFAAFNEAPIETALVALFTGLSIFKKGFTVKSTAKVLLKIAFALAAIDTIGTELAKLIDSNVSKILGDQTIFEYVFKDGFLGGLKESIYALDIDGAFGLLSKEIENQSQKLNKQLERIEFSRLKLDIDISEIETNFLEVSKLTEEYSTLSLKTDLTEEDIQRLGELREGIEEFAELPKDYIDPITGAWKGTKEELSKVIEEQKKYLKLQAYQGAYVESTQNLLKLENTMNDLKKQINDNEMYSEVSKWFDDLIAQGYTIDEILDKYTTGNEIFLGIGKLAPFSEQSIKDVAEIYKQTQKVNNEYNKQKKFVEQVEKEMNELNSTTSETSNSYEKVNSSIESVGDTSEKNTSKIINGFTNAGLKASEKMNALALGTNIAFNTIKPIDVKANTEKAEEKTLSMIDRIKLILSKGVEKLNIEVNTTPAINAVSTGVTAMNIGLGLIKTPNINANTTPATNTLQRFRPEANSYLSGINADVQLNSTGAVNQAWSLRDSIETALKGINIGLEVKLNAKVKDTIAAGFNAGFAVKQMAGEIRAYKAGGFPEDGWFRASHGEIMGRFDNGQSVVANNEQITTGIAAAVAPAVYNAVVSAMRETNNNNYSGDTIVNIDGKEVFRAVKKQADAYTIQNNIPAFIV